MTTKDFTKAKAIITSACNQTGLKIPDLVGVLSSVLADATSQMNYDLLIEADQLREQKKARIDDLQKATAKNEEESE